MTLQEISASLLNGFHDAHLDQLSVDYAASTIIMRFNLCLGLTSDDPELRTRYAKGNMLLSGMQYCVVEKPEDNGHGLLPSHFHATLDGFETAAQPELVANLPGLEPGYFAHSFIVFGWNCYIHVAAQSASITFDDPADQIYNDQTLERLIATTNHA